MLLEYWLQELFVSEHFIQTNVTAILLVDKAN